MKKCQWEKKRRGKRKVTTDFIMPVDMFLEAPFSSFQIAVARRFCCDPAITVVLMRSQKFVEPYQRLDTLSVDTADSLPSRLARLRPADVDAVNWAVRSGQWPTRERGVGS